MFWLTTLPVAQDCTALNGRIISEYWITMDVGQRSIYHKGMVTDTYILVLHHFHNYTHKIKELFAKNYLHQDHQQQTVITSGSRAHNIKGFLHQYGGACCLQLQANKFGPDRCWSLQHLNINPLTLSSYFTHHHVQHSEILCCCHSVHLSFAWISEQTELISLCTINWVLQHGRHALTVI